LQHFNSFTPEREMKARFIHPKQDVFYFTEMDHLMAFCREHKIRLHGHTLIWHKDNAPWMDNFSGNRSDWENMMKDHIQKIVSHCKSYVKSWDVVNEAFNDDGSLRQNIWLKNIGESYIEKAYQYAAEADSSAQLFYNDYSIEKDGPKLSAVLHYFQKAKTKGVKLHGIGMQMHVTLRYPSQPELDDAVKRIAAEGYTIHYSELDVRLNEDHKLFGSLKKVLALQKERVREIVAGYQKINRRQQFGITLWGVSDNDSWLTEDKIRSRPLLFDSRYRMKPAFCGFAEGLRN
jgi:endo-1,4-beta-xylanase